MLKINKILVAIAALAAVFCANIFAETANDVPASMNVTINERVSPPPKGSGEYDWLGRHQKICDQNKKIRPQIIFFGDSITHYWAGEPKAHRPERGRAGWDKLFDKKWRVTNAGCGFDYVDNVYYRVQNGELDKVSPKLIMVNIGTNNMFFAGDSPEVCAEKTQALLNLIRKKQPKAKILLIGVYPRTDRGKYDAATIIPAHNALLAKMADDKNIFFVDVGNVILAADGKYADRSCMGDQVHPNANGYLKLGEALAPHVRKLMK